MKTKKRLLASSDINDIKTTSNLNISSSQSDETLGYKRADRSDLTYEDWQSIIKQAAKNKDIEAVQLILIDLLELRYEM